MSQSQGQKILIVDDERRNLKILTDLLREDAEVFAARNGEQGLEKAFKLLPDLILMDVVMPGMDGFEVLSKLKKEPITRHIPVIFITGLSTPEEEKRGLQLGARDYIHKPFVIEIVKARVLTQLTLAHQVKLLKQALMNDNLTTLIPTALSEEQAASLCRLKQAEQNNEPLAKHITLIISLLQAQFCDAIEFISDLSVQPQLPIELSPLVRAIIPVLINSCEAIHRNGNPGRIEITAQQTEQTYEITITDNGDGMTPQQLQKVMQPLTSVKAGSGWGLRTAQVNLESLNGNITITSQPNIGTSVTMHMPKMTA